MNTNNIVKILAVVLIIGLGGLYIKNIGTPTAQAVTEEIIPKTIQSKENIQDVYLSWGKFNYEPEIIEVKSGKPVRITADTERLQGCFRSFQIEEFNVKKSFTESDNVLEFTPDKPGTYGFGCSMGMGNGKLVVT